MCGIFEGEGLTHREPALDEEDFERYVKSFSPLAQHGRDILCVLGGRTQTNNGKLRRIMTRNGFVSKEFHLCYNAKQMVQYGLFKRQRGVANSRNHELLFLCYKGRVPKLLARTRAHVDAGSLVFNEIVRNVPVLHPKGHALVSRAIRETSLRAMIGIDVAEVESKEADQNALPPMMEDYGAATADASAAAVVEAKAHVAAALKKRKLYRQLTGSEVPWFPHDNDGELLKELCHEAGRPRWVYFGTPAGGAGIHGCIEMGCSVLGLCFDEHHRTHLGPLIVQRAVEAMLGNTSLVFNNESLLARARQLKLTTEKDPPKQDKKEDKEEKKADEEDRKKGGKQTKKRKHVSSSSEEETDEEHTDEAEETKKKRKA